MRATEAEFQGTDRFHVLARLGAGGMGVVYKAFDREREAHVALKTLTRLDADELYRFKGEFRALADLHHPNWVQFGELFEVAGRWFFSMELVLGMDFLSHVRGRSVAPEDDETLPALSPDGQPTLPLAQAAVAAPGEPAPAYDEARLRASLAQLARGLAALHAIGKVHRDIKPSNILVTREGQVKILDFGLVQDLREARGRVGTVGGTLAYMAPEQALQATVGPAADWYAFGAMLYEVLTGRLPHTGSLGEVLHRKLREPPPPPRALRPEAPADLDALCTALLSVQPDERPGGADVLRRLSASDAEVEPQSGAERAGPFVGRSADLEALRAASEAARGGQGVTVLLAGESGVGKSALVAHFTEALLAALPRPVALAGRCYEGESVPFKAFDGVVDALSIWLASLPASEAIALLDADASLLAQTFLVLRRIPLVVEAPSPAAAGLDPIERRERVFAALRALFGRLARRAPLVIAIDDLQWADADSLALLRALLRAPGAPPLLLLITTRAASLDAAGDPGSALGAAPGELGDVRRLELTPLSPDQALALARELLGPTAGATAVAEESGGHPLFIQELVRHRRASGGTTLASIRLDDALLARIERLDRGAQRLLELVAVAGAPLAQATVALAAEIDFGELSQRASLLRAESLVRTAGLRPADAIEPYHDRVREAVVRHLDAPARAALHRRLALALEASAATDADALATHWHGAGDAARTATYTLRAAALAAESLAFDRAVQLYQRALELHPAAAAEATAIRVELGHALANAGRGAEAAAAYLEAAHRSPKEAAIDLTRRAADQLLRSGRVDEGLAAVKTVVQAIGLDPPEDPRATLVSFLLRRAQVRLRGLDFRPRPESQVPPAERLRVDLCFSASACLGLVDPVRGQYFQVRGLLFALDAGEPRRIAQALALETSYSGADGGRSRARTADLLRRTRAIADRIAEPYTVAWARAAEGSSAALEGRWKRGRDACDEAESIFHDQCTGAAWEIGTMRWFALWSLYNLGDVAELARRVPARLREASERGDLHAVVGHATGFANLVWLAADDPDGARARSQAAIARWSRRGFHVEHWWQLYAERQIDLYAGHAASALGAVRERWSAMSRSLLLMVQPTLLEALHLRGRCALALAREDARERRGLLRAAEADARRIERERMPWSDPLALLLRAGVAATRGDDARAAGHLAAAIRGLDDVDMKLYAAAARHHLGRLRGGDEGRALVASAAAFLAAQGVVNGPRMVAMLAPGFDG